MRPLELETPACSYLLSRLNVLPSSHEKAYNVNVFWKRLLIFSDGCSDPWRAENAGERLR